MLENETTFQLIKTIWVNGFLVVQIVCQFSSSLPTLININSCQNVIDLTQLLESISKQMVQCHKNIFESV